MSLTFDDGPGPGTEKVLEILRRYNVKATFFMGGLQAARYPAAVKQAAAEGHEIGSHTYGHTDYYHYTKDDKRQLLAQEMDRGREVLEKILGSAPRLLRMPHGYVRNWVKELAREKGYVLVNWTFGADWTIKDPQALADAYIANIVPGAIFLMHDAGKNRRNTLEALPKIIEEIQKRGFTITPVGTLLEQNENRKP